MLADAALEIFRIAGEARQEIAGAGGVDDRLGVVDRFFCAPSVERQGEVEDLARVGVHAGDERGIGLVEEVLVEGDLRRIARKRRRESVADDGAKILGVEGFAFPDRGIGEMRVGQIGSGSDDPVGVPLRNSRREP